MESKNIINVNKSNMINVNFYITEDEGSQKLLFSKRLPFPVGFTDHVLYDGKDYVTVMRRYNADTNSYDIELI